MMTAGPNDEQPEEIVKDYPVIHSRTNVTRTRTALMCNVVVFEYGTGCRDILIGTQ